MTRRTPSAPSRNSSWSQAPPVDSGPLGCAAAKDGRHMGMRFAFLISLVALACGDDPVLPCPANASRSVETDTCVCNPGFELVGEVGSRSCQPLADAGRADAGRSVTDGGSLSDANTRDGGSVCTSPSTCPTGDNATATCDDGVCGLACDDGYADCNADPSDGCEVDTLTDESNCGECGFECDEEAGTCSSGACIDPMVEVCTGQNHSCARSEAGLVFCWGRGEEGQLGHGEFESSSTPVRVSEINDAVELDCGGGVGSGFQGTSCVLRSDSSVWCWGMNATGMVGDGSVTNRSEPTRVLDDANDVSVGIDKSCAVLASRQIHCWGRFGEDVHRSPRYVGLTNARFVEGGVCSVTSTNTVQCFDLASPSEEVSARRLTAGVTSCATRRSDDVVVCWGDNTWGGLGQDEPAGVRLSPLPVAGELEARELGGKIYQMAAVTPGGAVYIWGARIDGEDFVRTSTPTLVALGVAVDVSAYLVHTCAVLQSGEVACWGGNGGGQLVTGRSRTRTHPCSSWVCRGSS